MDKKTIIAIILCVVVIVVGMTLQTTLFAPEAIEEAEASAETSSIEAEPAEFPYAENTSLLVATGNEGDSSPFAIENDVLIITFDPVGGSVSSIKMKDHTVKIDGQDELVELLYRNPDDENAFMLYYGDSREEAIDDLFNYSISEVQAIGEKKGTIKNIVFTRDFEVAGTGSKFTIEKHFAVPMNDEYMIQLAVVIRTPDGSAIPLGENGSMYTISVGPQIGPEFESLSGNYDYRRVIYKLENKGGRKTAKIKNGVFSYDSKPVDWIGLTGKYFAFLLIPEKDGIISSIGASEYSNDTGVPQSDVIYMTRSAEGVPFVRDIYSFYAGPQLSKTLGIYDRATDNIFGLADHSLKKALDVSWLGWLETLLKWILQGFYFVVRNYGVAIILLTILVKICLIPLSKKSMDSTAKMTALQPKIDDIKKRYPDDPQAQNQAIAKLYQEEKINPMGSCIPMLIQFPIFIALYGLLNKNFDLRGAMFIPGWIPDLSVPDTVYTLPFSIPLLGPRIHLLPIIYTVSMIFSMKITQTANTAQGQKGMMIFMTYGMPIIFFFVLYNAPSGLLIYWTVTNFISIGQQIWTNRRKGRIYKEEYQLKEQEKKDKKKAASRKRR